MKYKRIINEEWTECLESELIHGERIKKEVVNKVWQESNYIPESKESKERRWRDGELLSTDWIIQIPDHPQKITYENYRDRLRDYPSQPDFPNGTRPAL